MTYSAGASSYGGDLNSDAHGSARWMEPDEAEAAGLYRDSPSRILLAQNRMGKLAYFNGSGHVVVIAPARMGKGVGFVQGNLLTYEGSMVVIDPKGENASVTARHRKAAHRQEVFVLDPTGKIASYGLSGEIAVHGFNPLYCIQQAPDDNVIFDDIERLADALVVADDNQKDRHWRDGAKTFLKGCLIYLAYFKDKHLHHLIELSRLASGLDISYDQLFAALKSNRYHARPVQQVIERAGAWWDSVNPGERRSFVSMALRSLAWIDNPIWHAQLTSNDFDPRTLLNANTTVYIVCPFEKMEDYSPWFRLVISSCVLVTMRATTVTTPATLFMLDEYAQTLGRLAIVEQNIPAIEGLGGRYAFVFQNLGQMQKLWPDDYYNTVFANAGAHVFFNISDQNTAEFVSKSLGKCGALSASSGGIGSVQRELSTADELRTMPNNALIAFIRGFRPACLCKVNVNQHRELKGHIAANPLYLPSVKSAPRLPASVLRAPLIAPAPARHVHQIASAPSTNIPALKAAATSNLSSSQSAPNASLALVQALARQHPGKMLSVRGEMIGYCDMRYDPATNTQKQVFVPLLHKSSVLPSRR
jgi:type IV secretion system protein VirD4